MRSVFKKAFALIMTAAVAFSLAAPAAAAGTFSAADGQRPTAAADRQLRVMTYNIHFGQNAENVYDLQAIADVITASKADVVCLQEVDVNWGTRSNYDNTLSMLAQMTGMSSYNAFIYDKPSSRGAEYPNERFGVAFLSKYPIISSANHEITRWSTQDGDPQPGDANFPGTKPGFGEIVVDVDGVKVRFYNTHLDYRAQPPEGYPSTIRLDQVNDMLRIMDIDSCPTILAGDMNADAADPTAAEVFEPVLKKFVDSWAVAGQGSSVSFPSSDAVKEQDGTVSKARKIDYIFTTPGSVDVISSHIIDSAASDHRPVVADLVVHGSVWENPYSDVSESLWSYGAIRYVTETGLLQNASTGSFAPAAAITRAELAAALYRSAGSPAVTTSAGFTDVPAGQWYSDAVNWAASKGIVEGVGSNRFAPDDTVSREQLAVILYQYAIANGETPKSDTSALAPYGDSASVHTWATDGMAWAVGKGIITGKPGSLLAPADSTTRAEAAVMLMRFLSK